ncbi:pacearchaeosortase [archaeon]|jgi:exosortase/archaeosortase family protein|nr:pacearchaeosortase [archaeon]MBT4242187.1 pacearchaeosortase [archaeon]MBT4417875.1 pacearchaeosortase [archaeon]
MNKKIKKSKKTDEKNKIYMILTRYILLLLLSFSLSLIYKILTPLTINTAFILLKQFIPTILISGNLLIIPLDKVIEINQACVAGSAYLLLILINLTVPMALRKRIYTLLFSLITLFIINILRILIFTILYNNNFKYFTLTHNIFWVFLSTIFVVLIWLLTVKVFAIKDIPVYTDIKYLRGVRRSRG